MEWNNRYIIGVASIDAQHKELFRLLKRIRSDIKTGGDNKVIADTMRALVEYTRIHFSEEENYMRDIKYPSMADHKLLHEKLVEDVMEILLSIKNRQAIREITLLRFLNDWISRHIIDEDLKIGKYTTGLRHTSSQMSIHEYHEIHTKEDVIARFLSLAKQLQHHAVSHDYFLDTGKEILTNALPFSEKRTIQGLSEALGFIEHLHKKSCFNDDDKMFFNATILKKALADNIFRQFEDDNAVSRFLDNLKSGKQITDDNFNHLKIAMSSKPLPHGSL